MPNKVDILLPAFNAARTILEAISSLQRQTEQSIRILVINDGSTDITARLVSSVSASDPRSVLINTPNQGIVSALNRGLLACQAPFIARMDADDISFPNRIREQIAYLEDHPYVLAVSGQAEHIDEEGKRTGRVTKFGDPAECNFDALPCREPYLMHPFLMVRREALEKVGGYRFVFHAEDSDLYWRLQEMGPLHNMAEVAGLYRSYAGSISSKSVLNGRITAVFSQLAAISAKRRALNRQDISFPFDALRRLEAAQSLIPMLSLASEQLTPSESSYLRVAVAAKMLDLVDYRHYSLERSDRLFIKASWRQRKAFGQDYRSDMKNGILKQGTILLKRTQPCHLVELLPFSLVPALGVRACLSVGGRLFAGGRKSARAS